MARWSCCVPRLLPEKTPDRTADTTAQDEKMPSSSKIDLGDTKKKSSKGGLGEAPLYEPKDGKANVDIVFVHGIGGDRIKTWTYEARNAEDDVLWPQKFLPETLPNARILSFGYNADFVKFWPEDRENIAPELTIDDYSTSLLEALRMLRKEEEKDRPIIFVAHSMGGLVVANALSRDHKSDAGLQSLVDHTIGALFLGTPFLGSSLATYGATAASLLKNIMKVQGDSLSTLETKSKKLAAVNKSFAEFLKARDRSHDKPVLEIACFFEERPIAGKVFVVPKLSATWLGVNPLSIDANHQDMAKFDSEYSMGYKSVSGKLKQWIDEYEKNKNQPAGGVGGLDAQRISITNSPVDYKYAQVYKSVTLGNVVATKENAVYINMKNTASSSAKDGEETENSVGFRFRDPKEPGRD